MLKIYSFCCSLLLLIFVSNPVNLANASPESKPKVLLFSAIDGRYLADSLEYWGRDIGVNGFMLSYVADWWSTKDVLAKNFDLLKKINTQGRRYDIDRNFIKIALGYRELPLWSDEQAWRLVIANFKAIAVLASQTGTKGIAIDTEMYGSSLFNPDSDRFRPFSKDFLKAEVYKKGREIMQAMTAAYPDIEVILLQEGSYWWMVQNDKEYEMWLDFFKGVASVKNNHGIVIATESTYSITDKKQLAHRYNQVLHSMQDVEPDKRFCQEKCSLAIGMWPLGKQYDNKAARYSPSDFNNQFSQAVALSPKYVWIYDHGTAWFQLSKTDADKYTEGGKWIWEKAYQILPTDSNINDYFLILKNYTQGSQ